MHSFFSTTATGCVSDDHNSLTKSEETENKLPAVLETG